MAQAFLFRFGRKNDAIQACSLWGCLHPIRKRDPTGSRIVPAARTAIQSQRARTALSTNGWREILDKGALVRLAPPTARRTCQNDTPLLE